MRLAIVAAEPFPVGQEALAELLRGELAALGVSTRRVLKDRVIARMTPADTMTEEQVDATLRRLEEIDEFTSGPGGRIAAAPVRALRLEPGRYLLLGSLTTSSLAPLLPALRIVGGMLRRGECTASDDGHVAGQVAALRGRVTDAATWTGRVPPADAAWLAELDARLLDQVQADSPLWSVERWQVYAPRADVPAQHRRWRSTSRLGESGLIRGRLEAGSYAYAWTSIAQPPRLLPLTRDEARRTAYALDARESTPITLRLQREGAAVELVMDAALPYAEYRYLLLLGERCNWDSYPVRYRLPPQHVALVTAYLRDRLGVRVSEETVG